MNKKSFSMIYPVNEDDYIEDKKITLIGPEIDRITDFNVDFGMLILIGGKNLTEDDKDLLKILLIVVLVLCLLGFGFVYFKVETVNIAVEGLKTVTTGAV